MKKLTVFIFLICILALACKREYELYSELHNNNKLDGFIKFTSLLPDSISADGASSTIIKVQITPETDSIYRKVLFATDRGVFSNHNDSIWVSPDYNGQCSARLFSSNQIGVVIVKAMVRDIVIDTSINFTTSYPEDFMLSASEYVVDSMKTSSLKAELYRHYGSVSNNLKVSFFVEKNDTIKIYPIIKQYSFITNDSVQAVSIQNPFNAKGLFTFVAKVQSSLQDTIKKSIQIQFR